MRSRYVVAVLFSSLTLVSSAAAPQKERCRTRQPSLEEVDQIEQQISRARSKVKSSVTVPVWFHVIDQGSGFANGEIPESMIRGQLRVLEDSLPAAPGPRSSSSSQV